MTEKGKLKSRAPRPMDALEYRVWHALRAITYETYGKHMLPFDVEFAPKNRKTFHAYWMGPADGYMAHITMFNPERRLCNIIMTTIRELAHHCDYCVHGGHDHGHQAEFYEEYKKLVVTACRMGIVKKEDIEEIHEDSRDRNKIRKALSNENLDMDPEIEYGKGLALYKAFPPYIAKDTIKAKGYRYNRHNKSWEKIVEDTSAPEEDGFLSRLKIKYEKVSLLDIDIRREITVEGQTYECKDLLKSHNYRYNTKTRSWSKTISKEEREGELKWLKVLGTMYNINYQLK